ncbi:hypothetical protein M0812_27092 [Anaeramoeba flamelloides]|uniref:Reverse transcriptase domain-containing protein n=1 Tax=Anaeramoeba flamelloides TaxID=1746091 RepID=A0AAV7YEX1_9EUKA|nr:hypothetical protein M0812_27092 [Anaeramoeba flamelloides]
MKYTDLIYKENKKDHKIAPLIKNNLSNPNLIHCIKKINKEAWNKFIDEINLEFTKNKNFWKKINLIRSKKMKMILDNKNMIEEYFGHIQKNSIEPSKEILNYIKNLKIKKLKEFKIDIFFPIENIKNTIKNLKKKSVKGFQKIENLKYICDVENIIDLNQIENKNYEKYLITIQKIFNNWLINPDKNNIEYIKKRSILFIHKKGNEGVALNYRPISINQSLPRLFLKMLYKLIEPCWEFIHKSQFGFRKKYDTRIAV